MAIWMKEVWCQFETVHLIRTQNRFEHNMKTRCNALCYFSPLYCQQPKYGEFSTTADKCVEHTFCSITFLIGCSSENNNHYKSQACKVSWILCQIPFLSIDDNSRTPFAILESLGFICFKHLKHSAVSCTTNCHVLRTLLVSPTYRYFHQVFFRQLNITPA